MSCRLCLRSVDVTSLAEDLLDLLLPLPVARGVVHEDGGGGAQQRAARHEQAEEVEVIPLAASEDGLDRQTVIEGVSDPQSLNYEPG